jgi:riboflavin kinase/FMN adenylyltransferase
LEVLGLELLHDLYQLKQRDEKLIITIGAFDGVHVAHRALIAGAVMRAREQGVKSAVISFNPHPDTVVRPNYPMIYLTTLEDKAELIAEIGADYLIVQPFTTDFMRLTPEQFVDWLTSPANVTEIHVGEDFVFGHKASGNIVKLREMGSQRGFHVHSLAPLEVGNAIVSSTSIRKLLLEGDVEHASRLLDRFHSLQGIVLHGAQRGRVIGFPTANIEIPSNFAIPGNGVYATITTILEGDRRLEYSSVTNIGVRPTFDNGTRSIETHLLDFSDDIYDKHLKVQFVAKLRDERKFSGIEEIRAQLQLDVMKGREVLAAHGHG